mmetsp:Transcript_10747/g.16562  ORF Transcript_10747/g.16562 Transcript_10747/m.16562 type:complete len:104 (-) Transcript_10747:318-629(-)
MKPFGIVQVRQGQRKATTLNLKLLLNIFQNNTPKVSISLHHRCMFLHMHIAFDACGELYTATSYHSYTLSSPEDYEGASKGFACSGTDLLRRTVTSTKPKLKQ